MSHRTAGWLILCMVMLALPAIADAYWVSLVTQMLVFGLLALSADLLLGNAGLFSLCHAAFFSVAAYASAITQVRYGFDSVSGMAFGILMGTALGFLFGLAVRTRGVYFILVTLAMGYVIWGVGYRWSALTGGDSGITNVPAPRLGPWSVDNGTELYFLILGVVAVVMFLYSRFIRSPFGLALRGIKSGEPRMKSLGYNTPQHLYLAFVISSFMSSVAGVLYVCFNKFVNPVSASLHVNVETVLMAIVGGSGTLLGPFLGAGLILGLRNWVSTFFELHLAVMGLVFMAVVIWAPGGVMGLWHKYRPRGGAS
jgi:branched-chain amino acid transport system permease protein